MAKETIGSSADLTQLYTNLQTQAGTGSFDINATSLQANSGLSVPADLDQFLQSSLLLDAGSQGFALVVTGSSMQFALSNNNQTLTVTGGTISALNISNTVVKIIFSVDTTSTLQFILDITPASWTFAQSFPTITGVIEGLITLDAVHLIFSTQAVASYEFDTTSDEIVLTPGLNFADVFNLANLTIVNNFLQLADPGFTPPSIVLSGNIKPPEPQSNFQCFPAMDISASIAGTNALTFFDFLTFQSPSISIESNSFGSPNFFLNLQIVIATTNSTTVAAASNNQALPTQQPISVGSTANFPNSGILQIATSTSDTTFVSYQNIEGNTFTNCSGGSGTLQTSDTIYATITLDVKAAVMKNSNLLRIYLSSGDLTLQQVISIIPGGTTVWADLPGFLTECLDVINFYSFSADFVIGTNSTITSLQAVMGSNPAKPLQLFNIFTFESFLASWTCLNPTSTPSQNMFSFNTSFAFPFIPQLNFNVIISSDKTISGSCTGTLSLSDLINLFNKQGSNQITIPFDVSLSNFQFTAVEDSNYTFGATANESLKIMGQEILAVENAQFTISVTQTGTPGNFKNTYAANVTGILNLFGIDFSINAQIGTGTDPTTISIRMLNRTLGELLDMLVKLISRDSKAILPFPWSKLNDIQMDALTLTMTISATQHEVTVNYSNSISLGFIDISSFTLSYTKNLKTETATTNISLDCTFFGQSYSNANNNALAWDPVNGNPPPVPDQGSTIDIRYLGLGQHLGFAPGTDTSSMENILMALENIAPPPPRPLVPGMPGGQSPSANPLKDLPALTFNGSSNWFIGTDFTVAGAVSLGLVFNDPSLYGLIVKLSGPKVKSLAGLQFEILYRKINNNIGEYYTELKLPAAMRHLEMGEVSITLPSVSLAIYTNGNFEVDFGFPWNNNFSNSFGLQVFPFVGAGGFYFGVLDGATSTQVPVITNGSFDPVIVFGFGLQAGVGKSINEGVLSASAEITVAGILQGVFGFFKPSDHSAQPATFYQLQGVAAISGVVSGTVNFAIIQANIMIMVYADCHVTYECYQPIQLGVDVGVEVEVSLKVLFIHVHFSFSTTLHENFTIGSASPTPWALSPIQNGNGGMGRTSGTMLRSAVAQGEGESGTDMRMMAMPVASATDLGVPVTVNWTSTNNSYFTVLPQLQLQFVPMPLVASPVTSGTNVVSFNAMLFIDNSINGNNNSSFDLLMQATLAWVLKNSTGTGLSMLTEASANSTSISYHQLNKLIKALTGNAGPLYSDITSFISNNFSSLVISADIESINDGSGSHTVFAMIPELSLTYGTTVVDFKNQNPVDANYVNDVAQYLQSMNIIPTAADTVTFSGTESIPVMVFCDYFMLAIKAALQTAKSTLSLYPYTIQNTTVSTANSQLTSLGIDCSTPTNTSFENFVKANRTVSLATGTAVSMGSLDFTVTGTEAQSLNSIMQTLLGVTPTSENIIALLQNNLYADQLLLKGTTLSIQSLSYIVPDNSTTTINALFGNAATVTVLETPIPGAPQGYYTPYTKLLFQGGSFTTSDSVNTLALVAYATGTTPALIRGKNMQSMQSVKDNDPITPETTLVLPGITYVVKPDSQYYIATYFGVPQTSVTGTFNPSQTITISNISVPIGQPMNLAQLGNYLCAVDMNTLQNLIASQSIITPGISLTTPAFNYTSIANDTSASITQQFNVNTSELIFNNLAVFYPTETNVQIPEATVTVAELMQAMSLTGKTAEGFNNVAGQLSRFLLHGLNLPDPGQTIINTDGTANTNATTSPLYTLLGQQFNPGSAPVASLANPNNIPWISIVGEDAVVSLDSGPLGTLVSSLQSTNVLPSFSLSKNYTLYQESKQHYTLQHPIEWSVADLPAFMGVPAANVTSNPVIWPFPENLVRILSGQSTELTLNLFTGSRDIAKTSSMVKEPVSAFRWATMLTIQVKQINSKISPSGHLSYIYEVEGMKTEAERHALTALIQAYKADQANSPDVRFLFNDADGGVISDHLIQVPDGSDLVRIVKSNLSTMVPLVELYSLSSANLDLNPVPASSPASLQGGMSINTTNFSSHNDSRLSWVIGFPQIAATAGNYACYNWADTSSYTAITLPPASKYASGISFYACGQNGGEIVSFGITVPPVQEGGQAVPLSETITLTNEWTKYEISFAELEINQVNPEWWKNITIPFSCTVSEAQNSGVVTFAIDQVYGIQVVGSSVSFVEAGISNGLHFLELLWEGSLLRNGGYFLQYQNAQGNGLPDYLFSQGSKADVRLLVLCPTDIQGVSAFHNTVVLQSSVDLSNNVLFAQADSLKDYHSVLQPGNLGLNLTAEKTGPTSVYTIAYNQSTFVPSQLSGSGCTIYHKSGTTPINYADSASLSKTATVWETQADPNDVLIAWGAYGNSIQGGANKIVFWMMSSVEGSQITVQSYAVTQGGERDSSQTITLHTQWTRYELLLDSAYPAQIVSPFALINPSPNITFALAVHAPEFAYINDAADLIQSMYNMLSLQVNGNSAFKQSIISMPAGPQTAGDEKNWNYHLALPVAKFAICTTTRAAGYPDPVNNPYNAVGNQLSLNINAQDIFGNWFSQSIANLPQPLYYDRIIPVNQWPGVAASYDFGVGPQLNTYLHFDVSRYLPVGQKKLSDCINRASKDQIHFQSIYYQLTDPLISFTLTSMITGGIGLTTPQISQITNFVGAMYMCAATIQQLQAVNITPSGANNTLAAIANAYNVKMEDLADVNKLIPSIFSSTASIYKPVYYTVKYNDSIQSICNAAVPVLNPSTWVTLIANETTILKPGIVINISNTTTPQLYTIQPGDSLNSIVQKYSSVTSLTLALLTTNNLTVQNIFEGAIQLLLSSSVETLPAGDTSLESIAKAWDITVQQLVINNSTAELNSAVTITIPDTYGLENLQNPTNYSIFKITSPTLNSLSAIATNQSVDVTDLFLINQGLAQVVSTASPVKVTIAGASYSYTPNANDTLLSIYNNFLGQAGPGFSQEQFISQINSVPIFSTNAIILLPPTTVTINNNNITPNYTVKLFEINASIEISRPTHHIDPNVPAEVTEVTSVSSPLTAHTDINNDGNITLHSWAQKFESAFPGAKIAVHRNSSGTGSTNGHIWAVLVEEANPANNNVIGYTIDGNSAMYFAPAPLANQLVSREQVSIQTYRSGVGFAQTSTVNFNGIDMDQWAQQFISALNILCSPDFAVPASDLNPAAFIQIMQAKQQIASSISNSVISILENKNGNVADRIEAASEILEERLLQDISSAYTVESIVQLDVNVQNSRYTALGAPGLIGKPLTNTYTVDPTKDTLASIASTLFTQPVAVRYLARQIENIQGLIASHALNKNSFTIIPGLMTQDSANIFDQLMINNIIDSNGIIESGFNSNTVLNLNPAYSPVTSAVTAQLLIFYSAQQNSILKNGQSTTMPLSTYTLKSLSKTLGYTSVDDFAKTIKEDTILGAVVLNPAWYAYTPGVLDTLGSLTDYFNTTAYEIVLANLANPALLQANNYTINNIKCTVTTGETLETLLGALNITVNDFISDTNATCIALMNTSGLLSITGQAGVLLPQSTITLSTTELPLTATNSYLNFILSKNGGSNKTLGENAFVDLSYHVNGLQKQSDRETLPGFEDYSTLSFVISPKPVNKFSLEIPIPLRDVPSSPILLTQNAVLPQPGIGLPGVRQWNYEITYCLQELSQDEIEIKVALNQEIISSQSLTTAESHPADLFSSLAWFICTWPALEADLNALPHLSESLPIDAKIQSALSNAVASFAQVTSDIAQKWITWKEDSRLPDFSSTNDYGCSIQEFEDSNGNFAVHIRSSNYNLPCNSYPSVLVIDNSGNTWSAADANWTIMDYTTEQQEVVNQLPDTDIFKFVEVIYTNFKNGNDVLTFTEAQQYNTRQFSINNLDIVQTYSAWGSIAMSRNSDLINGQNTNPALIYRTPWVKFSSPCVPHINSTQAIDISQPPITGTTQNQTLETYLSNLFGYLLELQQPDQPSCVHQLKLSCRYSFSIGNTSTSQPVFLHPEYIFNIHDWEISDVEESKKTFVQRMAKAITTWQSEVQPNTNGGQYIFDLALLSGKKETDQLLNFLVKNNTSNLPGAIVRSKMPLSFYIPNDYWISPPNNQSDPNSVPATAERILAYYGADIYDVATAQIALSICPDFLEGIQVAQDWTNRLLTSESGVLANIRGWSNGSSGFLYGQNKTPIGNVAPGINNPATGPYFFRMISDQWQMSDPLTGETKWPPSSDPKALNGSITWIDWKPITGENAWGAILGPLQLEYRKTGGFPKFDSNAVQLALKVIPAYLAMQQTGITGNLNQPGAIFYAPANTAANTGGNVDPYSVSNENNFSSFAALTALMEILSNCYINETDSNTRQQISAQFNIVQGIAQGIQTYFKNQLLDTVDANGPCFYTGGTYGNLSTQVSQLCNYISTLTAAQITAVCTAINTVVSNISPQLTPANINTEQGEAALLSVIPSQYSGQDQMGQFLTALQTNMVNNYPLSDYSHYAWTGGGTAFPFAVDVHTWGCTVLGIDRVDTWFASDNVTAYSLWQTVKERAGYFVNGDTTKSILGVGYTDVPTDPSILNGANPHEFIISAEWTFGAITMCRIIGQQYLEKSQTADVTNAPIYANYAANLFKDAETMMNGVRNLLLDTSRANDDIYAYYYANRRYYIPFGWYSNRVDSLCSTAWGVMVQNDFNPFVIGGSYDQKVVDPNTYTLQSWQSGLHTQVTKGNLAAEMTAANINSNLQGLTRFLVMNNTKNPQTPSFQYATGMPLSFFIANEGTPNSYWNQLNNPNSSVYDSHYSDYCTNHPTRSMTERTLIHYGVDIYDAATMQCALAVYPDFETGIITASSQTKRLLSGFSIPSPTIPETTNTDAPASSIRGWTSLYLPPPPNPNPNLAPFYYGQNKTSIFPDGNNPGSGAYFFRSISDQFTLTDPLTNNQTSWSDWKPITGENAWAAFIGPLQVAFSSNGGIPAMDDEAVQLALKVLPAYQAMVSPSGGVFYCPWNMSGNTGEAADPFQLSNENNFSSLAGLRMLQTVLQHNNDQQYLPIVDQLVSGIEDYLKNNLYDTTNNCFFTGGTYSNSSLLAQVNQLCSYIETLTNDQISTTCTAINQVLTAITPTVSPANINTSQQAIVTAISNAYSSETDMMGAFINALQKNMLTNYTLTGYNYFVWSDDFTGGGTNFPFAVDVHTWGCSVLGVDTVDSWFKKGTAYNLWQTVKQKAGYFQNGNTNLAILGVGYTDVPTDVPTPYASIISAEWTFGAINACRILSAQYANPKSQFYNPQYAASLIMDAQSMMAGVQSLLLDTESIDAYTQAYFYANRRYNIPFGWYANHIDSLCSTSWGIMVANDYNPFVIGGGKDYKNIGEGNLVYGVNKSSKPSLQLSGLFIDLDNLTEGNQKGINPDPDSSDSELKKFSFSLTPAIVKETESNANQKETGGTVKPILKTGLEEKDIVSNIEADLQQEVNVEPDKELTEENNKNVSHVPDLDLREKTSQKNGDLDKITMTEKNNENISDVSDPDPLKKTSPKNSDLGEIKTFISEVGDTKASLVDEADSKLKSLKARKALIWIIIGILIISLGFWIYHRVMAKKHPIPLLSHFEGVREIEEIEFVTQYYEEVVPVTDEKGQLKFLLTVPASVTGKMDMTKMEYQVLSENMVQVTLPEVLISDVSVDLEKVSSSYNENLDIRLFLLGGGKEYDKAYVSITKAIEDMKKGVISNAIKNGIVTQAMQEARMYFIRIAGSLGYQVKFIQSKMSVSQQKKIESNVGSELWSKIKSRISEDENEKPGEKLIKDLKRKL